MLVNISVCTFKGLDPLRGQPFYPCFKAASGLKSGVPSPKYNHKTSPFVKGAALVGHVLSRPMTLTSFA